MLFGRVAFERLAAYWPSAGAEASPVQVRRMHELPKYVLSRTLKQSEWHNSHLLGDDPAHAIAELKRQDGRDLALFAGGKAASTAIKLGVVDELRVILNPALLSGGSPLFNGSPTCESPEAGASLSCLLVRTQTRCAKSPPVAAPSPTHAGAAASLR
jgi:dihydrofolate reductase